MLSHNDRGVYALIVNTITQKIGVSVFPSSVSGTLTNKYYIFTLNTWPSCSHKIWTIGVQYMVTLGAIFRYLELPDGKNNQLD